MCCAGTVVCSVTRVEPWLLAGTTRAEMSDGRWRRGAPLRTALALNRLIVTALMLAAVFLFTGAAAEVSLEDAILDVSTPEAVLSRHRRFLFGTSGSKAAIRFSFGFPVEGNALTFRVPFSYNLDSQQLTGGRRRNYETTGDSTLAAPFHHQEGDRFKMIQQVEDYLGRFAGVDGHGCMLRTLCEMAQVPDHTHGFMGDVFNLMLTPAHILDGITNMVNPNEYIRAQKDGRVWDDCSAYYQACPHSFFEFIETELPQPQHPSGPYVYDPLFPEDHPNRVRKKRSD